MTRESLVLIGAGGHAAACIDVVEEEGRFAIAGLIAPNTEEGVHVLGYRVLGTDAELPTFASKYARALIAVGQIKTPAPRVRIFELLQNIGYQLPIIVSPRAYVSRHARLGAGTIVMHGAVVNAGAVIGNNCIINSRALVEHDVVIADHCHIATAACINGGVRIGGLTFIGSGTIVREGLTVGERCVIGMGQRILTDCQADTRLPQSRSA